MVLHHSWTDFIPNVWWIHVSYSSRNYRRELNKILLIRRLLSGPGRDSFPFVRLLQPRTVVAVALEKDVHPASIIFFRAPSHEESVLYSFERKRRLKTRVAHARETHVFANSLVSRVWSAWLSPPLYLTNLLSRYGLYLYPKNAPALACQWTPWVLSVRR